MLLYKHQVIRLKRHNEPAIFLGYDKKNSKHIWAICLDKDGNPELDWFQEVDVEHYHVKSKESLPTPGNTKIFFGQFKTNSPLPIMHADPTKEDIAKFGAYVTELFPTYAYVTEEKETIKK